MSVSVDGMLPVASRPKSYVRYKGFLRGTHEIYIFYDLLFFIYVKSISRFYYFIIIIIILLMIYLFYFI